MSKAAKGKPKPWLKGKVASEETRKKISEANKGRVFSAKHRKKLSKALKGRVFSEEWKRKLSEAQINRWQIKYDLLY